MPSAVQKLQKFFNLERDRKYDNRAIFGGLDKMLPSWEKEARESQIPEDFIQVILAEVKRYPDSSLEDRAVILDQLTARLSQYEEANRDKPARPQTQERRPAAAPRHAPSRPQTPPEEPPHPVETLQQNLRSETNRPPRRQPSEDNEQRSSRPRRGQEGIPGGLGLNAPLTVISGVGPGYAKTLAPLGLRTLEDLLYYFPRRYDDYSKLKPIQDIFYGEELTLIATVQSINTRAIAERNLQITEMVVSDGTGSIRLTWFNQPYQSTRFPVGTQVVLSGRIEQYLGRMVMNNPEIEQIESDHLHTNRIVPVYPLAARVTQRWLRRVMYQTVNYWASRVEDYLPARIRQSAGLADLSLALSNVHFPTSNHQLEVARQRLAFDEIFLLQLGVLGQKKSWQSVEAQVFETPSEWFDQRLTRLPYTLTPVQVKALGDIRQDLAAGRPMNRLLQGDVGSGKTVVAALAMEMVVRHGSQAALMAPTSILAEQHYRSLLKLMTGEQTDLQPDQIRLLIGDTPENEKEEIRQGLADGRVKVIIGTHALLEGPVTFQRLQLAVIDEQHRFGVTQRALLRSKGESPHLLVMTATPIPRSLALTLYGDLDISIMDQMPAGRQPIETHVVPPIERERAYSLIRAQLVQGRQAFIVYPRIDGNDKDETKAAVEEHARLQREVFPKYKLGLLHGRMKPEEKEEVMTRFRNQEYHLLVSTTVVEVGVDIPNATVMLIESANHFGLAQLHQLRGRVGRGDAASYCLLIPEKDEAIENERLAAMAETNDGFVLAERDLKQRGAGDFLGTRQSGFMELKMASLTDVQMIEKARQQAIGLFEADPELSAPEHQALAKKLRAFWGGGKGDIS